MDKTTGTAPTAAVLLSDWITENFSDWNANYKSYTELDDHIEINLPFIMNKEKGQELLRTLTLTVPRYSIFEVDGVSICDPNFFEIFRKHLLRQARRFDASVAQFIKDGSLPNRIE